MRYCPMSLTMSWLIWVRATVVDLSPSSCPFSAAPLVSALAPFCTQPLLDCILSAFLRVFLRGGSKPSSLPVNSSLVEARIISDYPLFTFIFKPNVGERDCCAGDDPERLSRKRTARDDGETMGDGTGALRHDDGPLTVAIRPPRTVIARQ